MIEEGSSGAGNANTSSPFFSLSLGTSHCSLLVIDSHFPSSNSAMQQSASPSLAPRKGYILKCSPSALQDFALLQIFLTRVQSEVQ